MKEIVPHYIAKIEGHGSLRIDYTTDSAKMQIHEGERLFEGMLIGRDFMDGVFIPQRICGVCPTAHCMAALKALEYAMGVEVSETTRSLRKLMLAGQIIQSHALHLFFLVLPDYMHVDSVINIATKHPDKFGLALRLKKIGDKIVEVVGGRPVHPVTPEVGGFSKVPSAKVLGDLRDEIEELLPDGLACIELFSSLQVPELENPSQYLSIRAESQYGFYGGKIVNSTSGDAFDIADYNDHVAEIVRPYSTAKFAKTQEKGFMVGSLARMNLHSDLMNPMAKQATAESGVKFPSYNSFHNNLCQAIEILHFLEEAIIRIDDVCGTNAGLADHKQDVRVRAGVGSGAVEAPRGTLYYTYGVGGDGKITECNIITPTVQNLANIEFDAAELLHITEGKEREEREDLLEMLVRAYDPCITCSVH